MHINTRRRQTENTSLLLLRGVPAVLCNAWRLEVLEDHVHFRIKIHTVESRLYLPQTYNGFIEMVYRILKEIIKIVKLSRDRANTKMQKYHRFAFNWKSFHWNIRRLFRFQNLNSHLSSTRIFPKTVTYAHMIIINSTICHTFVILCSYTYINT